MKKKVLIIDDDALIRETVRLALAHAGFDASQSEDSTTALDLIRGQKPDLVILDLYMPGVSGFELCRALKAHPETKHIPVLIFTGSNETVDVIGGIDAGAFQYITKPVDSSVLVSKIKGILKDK